MTVHIAPASEDDAREIARVLESGVCPWPGYELRARTLEPWVYVLKKADAEALLAQLYPAVASRTGVSWTDPQDKPTPTELPVVEKATVEVFISEEKIVPVAVPAPEAVTAVPVKSTPAPQTKQTASKQKARQGK